MKCTPPTDWTASTLMALVLAVQLAGSDRSPARDELWVRLSRIAQQHVRRRMKPWHFGSHEIEDATHDVLVELFGSVERYRPNQSLPLTFFWHVASNRTTRWLHEHRRNQMASGQDLDSMVDGRSGPAGVRFDFPSELSLPVRATLWLRTEGYTLAEIAAGFDLPPGTLRQAIYRELRAVRSQDSDC